MGGSAAQFPIQRCLRAYALCLGRRPLLWFLVYWLLSLIIILVGFITTCTRTEGIWDTVDFQFQWSSEDGKTADNLNLYKDRHGFDNPWRQPLSAFMLKYDDKSNIFNKAALERMYEVQKDIYGPASSVDVDGFTYTYSDLCGRGLMPDVPNSARVGGFPPKMPCLDSTPINCFSEMHNFLDPTFQPFDANNALMMKTPLAAEGPVSYKLSRPSFRSMTDEQIKKTLSTYVTGEKGGHPELTSGCYWWNVQAGFPIGLFAGHPRTFNNRTLQSSPGIRAVMYWEGLKRMQYRMAYDKPAKSNAATLKKAMRKMSDKIGKLALAKSGREDANGKKVMISQLEDPDTILADKLTSAHENTKVEFFIISGVLSYLFLLAVTGSPFRPIASRAWIATIGCELVLYAQVFSIGLFWVFQLHMNGVAFSILPLLGLGIGMDDMFVLTRCLSDLGSDFIMNHQTHEILGQIFCEAGPGTTITSVCNTITFLCGYFLPVRGMRMLCMLACCIAICNYYVMMNCYVPLMSLEIARIKKKQYEQSLFGPCQCMAMKNPKPDTWAVSGEEFSGGLEKMMQRFFRECYGPFVTKTPIKIGYLVLWALCAASAVVMISKKSVGWVVADFIPKDDINHAGLVDSFAMFNIFDFLVIGYDLDISTKQDEILQLYKDMGKSHYTAPFLSAPFLTYFYQLSYLMTLWTSGALTMGDMNFAALPFATQAKAAVDTGFTNVLKIGLPTYTGGSEWADPYYAPLGEMWPGNIQKFMGAFSKMCTVPPDPKKAWDAVNLGGLFQVMDQVKVNEFNYDNKGTSTGGYGISFWSIPMFLVNCDTQKDFLNAIEQQKDIISKSPLKDNVFAYGSIQLYWELFIALERYFWILTCVGSGVIFFTTLIIFHGDIVTAIAVCISCLMLVLQTFGFVCVVYEFNFITAAFALLGLGLSVEFTAHFASTFSLGSGETPIRMGNAMAATFPPMLEGAFSTFFSILPLAWYPIEFIPRYFTCIMFAMVVFGLLNGLVFLPMWLAWMAPIINCIRGSKGNGAAGEESNEMEKVGEPVTV